eukprot:GILJ01007985.1.p1 GENE.GILJ01007985.1~~GILJ01007985.1.p1  ORF type:complete len:197 (-),score=18.10 GILJ01007985.1:257-847(-)
MSFILQWMRGVLDWLYYFKIGRHAKITFVGLDDAGKTTLFGILRDGTLRPNYPTLYPHSDEINLGKLHFKAFDMGGHPAARVLWESYFAEVDGIVFVVDAANPKRFAEARDELNKVLSFESIANVPIVVLGNKIDDKRAVSEEDFRVALGLDKQLTYGPKKTKHKEGIRPIELFMCSVVGRAGYPQAFQWLAQFVE